MEAAKNVNKCYAIKIIVTGEHTRKRDTEDGVKCELMPTSIGRELSLKLLHTDAIG